MPKESIPIQLKGGYRLPKPDYCPDDIYSIIEQCWHKDPNERYTFKKLCELLEDINISKNDV